MNILYISKLDWFWTKQRPQQLVTQLSKHTKIDFLSLKPWRNNGNKVIRDSKNDNIKASKLLINDNMSVYRVKVMPKRNKLIMQAINNLLLKRYIKNLIKKNQYDMIVCTHPTHVDYLPSNLNIRIIYDCMDDQLGLEPDDFIRERTKLQEKRLVQCCELIIATSFFLKKQLVSRYKLNADKVTVINNGVDTNNFKLSSIVGIKPITKKPIIGYVGSIDYWFDLTLILNSAKKHPEFEYKFIGPIGESMKNKIANLPKNVNFSGSIIHSKVPEEIQQFSVAIMPFIANDMIKSVNPVKLYEYLALGRPTISIKYPETEKFSKVVSLYINDITFDSALMKALSNGFDEGLVAERLKFAKQNSWEHRAREFLKVIDNKT